MSRINRVPKGLQDLLGSQNLGDNPSDLSLLVQPQVDMFPFWSAERLTVIGNVTFSFSNSDAVLATFTIPDGEAWIPLHISAQAALASVGDSVRLEIQCKRFGNLAPGTPGPNISFTLASMAGLFTAISLDTIVALSFAYPLREVWPAGTQWEVFRAGGDITAANGDLRARMLYYRLRV